MIDLLISFPLSQSPEKDFDYVSQGDVIATEYYSVNAKTGDIYLLKSLVGININVFNVSNRNIEAANNIPLKII